MSFCVCIYVGYYESLNSKTKFFEPARGDPNRFLVCRLNRSATNAEREAEQTTQEKLFHFDPRHYLIQASAVSLFGPLCTCVDVSSEWEAVKTTSPVFGRCIVADQRQGLHSVCFTLLPPFGVFETNNN